MATLKEISQRTGYATATISRILSGDPTLSVTQEARRKVLEEAGRLNYAETKSRRGRTPKGVLRVGIAEMLTPQEQLEDPYYLYLSGFVRQGCVERRYTPVMLEHQGAGFVLPDQEGPVDGIVAIGLFSQEQIETLALISPHVVFLDSSPQESRFDSVVLNFPLGISLALDHLIALGHTAIGFVGPEWKLDDLHRHAPELRRRLFCQQMEERGLLPKWLIECPMEVEAAAKAMAQRLSQGGDLPTAYLTANEETAIGVIRALHQGGIRVPEQVSVVSFNDTPRSSLVEPPLTSVSAHVEELARTALQLLRGRIPLSGMEPDYPLPLKVVVPPSLVRRASTREK